MRDDACIKLLVDMTKGGKPLSPDPSQYTLLEMEAIDRLIAGLLDPEDSFPDKLEAELREEHLGRSE